jgi:hypothetical protein
MPVPAISTPDEVVAVVVDPVTGRSRVGEYAAPIYPLLG